MTGRPVEILQWENTSSSEKLVQLVINRYSGGDPRLKLILVENGRGVAGTEYPTSGGGDVVGPTVFGHAGSVDAIAVGAVKYTVDPESGAAAPERYSSRGPSTLFFGPVPASGAAPELGSPEVLSKPDIAATDCGQTTFFAHVYTSGGPWRFCGTSAAAPHAAGVVALMKALEPSAEPAELRAALVGTATPFAVSGSCAMGAGLVEAVGGMEAILGGATVAPQACEPPDVSGPVAKAAGVWDRTEETATVTTPPIVSTQGPEGSAPSLPATRFLHHPRRVVRTRRAPVRLAFRFGSDQADVAFLCRVDRGRFHQCGRRLRRRFGAGGHAVRVKARNAAGLVDATPAVYRFRVQRVLRRDAGPHRRS